MKTTLFFSILFASMGSFAQEQVTSFYTPNASGTPSPAAYSIVESFPTINVEGTFGENIIWNFNRLTQVGTSVTETVVPTALQAETYPDANAVVHTVSTHNGEESIADDIFLATASTGTSITGIVITSNTGAGIILNYAGNAGFLGTFPLTYGYVGYDTIAGTYQAGVYTGSFTGSSVTTVDAYGTLTVNVGTIPANTPVTRVKIVQQFTLDYAGISVGTIYHITYNYYNSSISATNPVFRCIGSFIDMFEIQQDSAYTYEVFNPELLNDKSITAYNKIVIAPNPVTNVLHFAGNETVTGVTVTDFSGRVVLQSKSINDIPVSHLSAGIYNVAIESNYGVTVQKMVKQ